MSERIRLEAYLPVEIDGVVGYCQELSIEEWVVDLPQGIASGREVAATLRCGDSLSVGATLRAEGELDGAPGGLRRTLLVVASYQDSGRSDLVGFTSSLRKAAHLNIVAEQDVEALHTRAGWRRWRLPHVPLPERDPDALDLGVDLLGHRLRAPLLIAGMTGGSERAGRINRRLAVTAQELGLGLGLGSQRAMLERPELLRTYSVRDAAPDVLLLANVGAVQLNFGVSVDDVRRLVDAVQADALALHLNVLQELVQPEGDRRWAGLAPKIEALIVALDVPVVLKETGCGMDGAFALRARDLGASALDVGGTGGTAWGWIEGFRAADPQRQAMGATFRDWGIPTAEAVVSCRSALGPDFPLIATGGVRSGVDVATALALGADVAGMALPFFRAADESTDSVLAFGRRVVEELRIATLCSGAPSAKGLRRLRLEVR